MILTYMSWEKEKFQNFIIENNVIGFFDEPVRLKSGRISNWYVNWRNIAADSFLLDKLTDFVLKFITFLKIHPDCFYGVPEGASKLGVITQFKWARKQDNYETGAYRLPMGRGKYKLHGDLKDRSFLGAPKGKVVILEDTTTTGGSLVDTIKKVKELNVNILAAIGLTNRNELRDDGKSVEQLILEENVQYYAMSNALDILPLLKPKKEISKQIEEYFKKYGIKEIKFS